MNYLCISQVVMMCPLKAFRPWRYSGEQNKGPALISNIAL